MVFTIAFLGAFVLPNHYISTENIVCCLLLINTLHLLSLFSEFSVIYIHFPLKFRVFC